MADGRHWDDDRCYSSGSYSDDSPILSHRYEKRRYSSYTGDEPGEHREHRSTMTALAKVSLFCSGMILFCVLMYIPVYNKANYQYQMPKGVVSGWSMNTNRDTKIYVQPNNLTIIHEPSQVCQDIKENNKLLLLIIVSSSTTNFERRMAIRETWGNYENYKKAYKVFVNIKEKYKNYNYTHDLYPLKEDNVFNNISTTKSNNISRQKRDNDVSIKRLLPELAKALKTNMKTSEPDKKIENDYYNTAPSFDMNSLLNDPDVTETSYNDYDNIMRIPPKGYEDETPDLDKIITMLKEKKAFDYTENLTETGNTDADFKLVFLLGLPGLDNHTDVQSKIEEEVKMYGDVIQEGFIDSYNNLTLKSIMMLKWVTNKCKDSVRYILKTDDDMYINVPNLVLNLQNRSQEFDKKAKKDQKEYLLIGDLISGARPVQNTHDKWYSPRYMYGGKVYPRYLSGTGYCLSAPAARALYAAALTTHYFHLEDIYITGICSERAHPRIIPHDDPLFSYPSVPPAAATCCAHSHVTAHRVSVTHMRPLSQRLLNVQVVDRCERMRLTQNSQADFVKRNNGEIKENMTEERGSQVLQRRASTVNIRCS